MSQVRIQQTPSNFPFLIIRTSNKHRNDFEYFDRLCKLFENKKFYDNLLTYFAKRDISNFNPRDVPKSVVINDLNNE